MGCIKSHFTLLLSSAGTKVGKSTCPISKSNKCYGTKSEFLSRCQSTKLGFSFTYCAQVCEENCTWHKRTLDATGSKSSLVLFSSRVIIYHTFFTKSIDVTHTLYFTSVLHLLFKNCRDSKYLGDNFEIRE